MRRRGTDNLDRSAQLMNRVQGYTQGRTENSNEIPGDTQGG
jgi:hypothetical protein